MIILRTERLTVRPWTESDLDRAFDLYSRMEVARYLGSVPTPLTGRDQAAAMLERWRKRSVPDPDLGVWAVERPDGVIAGSVLLVPLTPSEGEEWAGEIEIGWHFHPDSWGHGYATEAAAGVLAKGFAKGLPEIFAVVNPANAPSIAVCRRLGMAALGRTNRWYGVELESFRIAPDHLAPDPRTPPTAGQ